MKFLMQMRKGLGNGLYCTQDYSLLDTKFRKLLIMCNDCHIVFWSLNETCRFSQQDYEYYYALVV